MLKVFGWMAFPTLVLSKICTVVKEPLPSFRTGMALSVIHGAPQNLPLLELLNWDLFEPLRCCKGYSGVNVKKHYSLLMETIKSNSVILETMFIKKFHCLNALQRERALEHYEEVIKKEYAANFPKNFKQLEDVAWRVFLGLSPTLKRSLRANSTGLEPKDIVYYKVILGTNTEEIKKALNETENFGDEELEKWRLENR